MGSYLERQINVFLWLSLIVVTVFLLGKLVGIFGLWAKARRLPGPRCPSFYGHYHLVSGSNLAEVLRKCHKSYGRVLKLWLGPSQLLVSITDKELVKEVLLKAEDKYPLTGKALDIAFGRSKLFSSPFDKVEHRRKSLKVELGCTLIQKTGLLPRENIVDIILEKIQNLMITGGVDCGTVSQHLAFTILGATLFGDSFLSWNKAIMYEELLTKIAKDTCFWASYGVTPFWKHEFWNYHHCCNKLKCLTLELVEQCRQNYKSGIILDFGNHNDARYELCGEILSLMFHGNHTMAALIGSMLTNIAAHPELQKKIYLELDVARNETHKANDEGMNVDGLPHLLATIYESARLLPAAPLLQRCSLKHDLNLKNGMVIPARAILIVPIQLVQMENSSWGNEADKFNPYRFLSRIDDSGTSNCEEILADAGCTSCIMKNTNAFEAFLPFGFGARSCLGQKLAILGISSLFLSLLGNYKISLHPESESISKSIGNKSILQQHLTPSIVFTKRSC